MRYPFTFLLHFNNKKPKGSLASLYFGVGFLYISHFSCRFSIYKQLSVSILIIIKVPSAIHQVPIRVDFVWKLISVNSLYISLLEVHLSIYSLDISVLLVLLAVRSLHISHFHCSVYTRLFIKSNQIKSYTSLFRCQFSLYNSC